MIAYKVTCFNDHWIDDYTDDGYIDVQVEKEEYFKTKDAALCVKAVYDTIGNYSEVTVTEIFIK